MVEGLYAPLFAVLGGGQEVCSRPRAKGFNSFPRDLPGSARLSTVIWQQQHQLHARAAIGASPNRAFSSDTHLESLSLRLTGHM